VKMMFYDLHVHYYPGIDEDAVKMGYSGLVFVKSSEELSTADNVENSEADNAKNSKVNNTENILISSETHYSLSVFKGIEIKAKNQEDLKRKVKKFRKKAEVLLVQGGDLKINRAAVEDARVDILSNPYYGRRDSGFNHVLAREAARNNVAVEINVGYFLKNHNHRRGKILAQFRELSKLKSKYNFPLVITSGAHSVYGLRSPHDLMELAACFGMDKKTAGFALSEVPKTIIKHNQIRNQIIVSGVRFFK